MNRSSKVALALSFVALLVPFYVHSHQKRQIPRSGLGVAVFSDEGQQAAFELPATNNFPNGPYVIIWLADRPQLWTERDGHPRTKDGRLVSGFKFAGWAQGGTAKIVATALVNDRSKEYASTEEQELEEQPVVIHVGKVGDTIRVSDMSRYGVKPLELRVMSAKTLFTPKPVSTVTEKK